MDVRLPNGQIAKFPDGMPKEEIQAVLRKQFPATQTQPQPATKLQQQGMTPRDVIRNAAMGRIDRGEAEAYLKSVALDPALIDEYSSEIQKQPSAAQQLLQGDVTGSVKTVAKQLGGGAMQLAGGYGAGLADEAAGAMAALPIYAGSRIMGEPVSLKQAYEYGKQPVRELQDEFSVRNPIASATLGMVGGVANPLMRKTITRPFTQTKTFGQFAQNVVRGALEGSVFGAAYGAGEGETPEMRAEMAQDYAKFGGLIGGFVPAAAPVVVPAVSSAVRGVVSAVKSPFIKKSGQTAQELAKQGIDASLATTSPKAQGLVTRYLANTYIGSGKVREGAERVSGQVSDAFGKLLNKTGTPEDAAIAGTTIQEGLSDARKAFLAQGKSMYDDALENIKQAPTGFEKLKGFLGGDVGVLSGTKAEKAAKAQAVSQARQEFTDAVADLEERGLNNLEAAKEWRSDIGARMAELPYGDELKTFYKRLYGAITEDIEDAAKQADPQSFKKLQDANQFWRKNINELESLERVYGNNKDVEQVFKTVASPQRMKDYPEQVASLMNRMGNQRRKTVSASVLRRLGTRGGDLEEFNPVEFAKNWEKIAPKAKTALLGGKDMANEFDVFTRNIRRVQPFLNEASPIRTGVTAVGTGTDIGAGGAILGGIATGNIPLIGAGLVKVAIDYGLSSWIMRPANIKLANKAMQGDAKAAESLLNGVKKVIPSSGAQQLNEASESLKKRTGGFINPSAFTKDLPMDEASRMQRARELGFGDSDDVYEIGKNIASKYGLDDLSMFKHGDQLKLDNIVVPKNKQGQGLGTKAVNDVVKYADENGLTTVLTTGLKDKLKGTTSSSRLKSFYKRFGFVENKGRNKDFSISGNMYRVPNNKNTLASRPEVILNKRGTIGGGF